VRAARAVTDQACLRIVITQLQTLTISKESPNDLDFD
jgi:hypothetical protein